MNDFFKASLSYFVFCPTKYSMLVLLLVQVVQNTQPDEKLHVPTRNGMKESVSTNGVLSQKSTQEKLSNSEVRKS